mgnify:CR=1 FL=1
MEALDRKGNVCMKFTCIECGHKYNVKTPGDPDERMCEDCFDSEGEEEYSVTIIGTWGVMAESQEYAENYILQQFYNGNTGYTQDVTIVEEEIK